MTVGSDLKSVIALHDQTKAQGVDALVENAERKSRDWVRAHESFSAASNKSENETGTSLQGIAKLTLDTLPERVAALFRRSLLVMGGAGRLRWSDHRFYRLRYSANRPGALRLCVAERRRIGRAAAGSIGLAAVDRAFF